MCLQAHDYLINKKLSEAQALGSVLKYQRCQITGHYDSIWALDASQKAFGSNFAQLIYSMRN